MGIGSSYSQIAAYQNFQKHSDGPEAYAPLFSQEGVGMSLILQRLEGVSFNEPEEVFVSVPMTNCDNLWPHTNNP